MSNNRNNNNNNRRRGRGNNRSQGGGNQLNRIDSRARGNAPQLLEKYKKLAHDAALNGDRVQAEYYLQFADHYFRVIADTRSQKDEPRGPRREFERERGEDDYEDDDFDRGQRYTPSRREEASETAEEAPRAAEAPVQERPAPEGGEGEPAENPFTRPARVAKPRRARRDRPEEAAESAQDDSGDRLDPSALPGAIGVESSVEEGEPAPRRAPRGRGRPRTRASGDDEELEAVG